MKTHHGLAIKTINVERLFGLHNYTLSVPKEKEEAGKIIILYGDNGSGKSTILKLAFHLLAPEDDEGHKSTAAPVPFKLFGIELTDGSKISAERSGRNLNGPFLMRIKRPRKKEAKVEFVSDEKFRVRPTSKKHNVEIHTFLAKLKELQLCLYMLSDDRQIHLAGKHDRRNKLVRDLEFPDDEIYWDPEIRFRASRHAGLDPEKIAQYLLVQSIRRAEGWIQSRAMIGSSIGESSVNSLYNEILRRLVALPQDQRVDTTSTKKSIEKRVSKLEAECKKFAQYGIIPEFQGSEILMAVGEALGRHLGIIANVLNPYLESIEKKLEALSETHQRVDSFVTVVNRFLTNKSLSFDLHSGLAVTAADGTILTPQMLSSGERHLFLLFCNSIVAIDRPSIMIIDEPEISLNVKWQRTLLSSLLECIGDSPVQYIFATHSLELLSQHRNRVVKLEDLSKV